MYTSEKIELRTSHFVINKINPVILLLRLRLWLDAEFWRSSPKIRIFFTLFRKS